MATLDQLSPDRRAIIELVLRQRRSYAEIADLLGMETDRVRELARGALVTLSPRSAERVEPEWRGQVADYALDQQSGPDVLATRAHLEQSEPARVWLMSLQDSLDGLYGEGGGPELPAADGGQRRTAAPGPKPADQPRGRPAAAAAGDRQGDGGGLSPAARAIVRRRRIAAGVTGAILLAALAAIAILLLTDDGGGGGQRAGGQAEQAGNGGRPRVLGQGELKPLAGQRGAGIAVIAERGNRRQLLVQAAGLRPSNRNEAYEVWLFNSPQDAVSLGGQIADAQGNFQGAGPLPPNFAKYKFIDVSRERVDQDRGHSGRSILRSSLSDVISGQPAQQQLEQQGGRQQP